MKKILMTIFLVLSFVSANSFAEEEGCLDVFSDRGIEAMVMKLALGDYYIGSRKPKLADLTEWAAICALVNTMRNDEEIVKKSKGNVKLMKEVDDYILGLAFYVLSGQIKTDDDIVLCKVNKKIQDAIAFSWVSADAWRKADLMGQPKSVPMGKNTCVKYGSTFELFK